MRTVITYGTYDLFHEGHRRLLERARELGDKLIVGVTTDTYDRSRGKLNVAQSLHERIENVRKSGLADQILVEEYDGQKIHDIEEWDVDVFAIGSDWLGKFDYLQDYCEVVYLDRTRGVSSTQLRNEASGVLRMGLAGSSESVRKVVEEARFVSGISVEAIWSDDHEEARAIARELELATVHRSFEAMLRNVSAVYIAMPPAARAQLTQMALEAGVHVLSEPPVAMSHEQAQSLLRLAQKSGLTMVDGVRTAYSPGFQRMVAYARSGSIGKVRAVDVTSTMLVHSGPLRTSADGGSIAALAAYPLAAVVKLLGGAYEDLRCRVYQPSDAETDLYARIDLTYPDAVASVSVGVGVRAEGDLRISGTSGSLYVPEPWWLTDHFETRFEDSRENQRFFVRFEGDGYRYELAELASRIRGGGARRAYKLKRGETLAISEIIERARAEGVRFG